MIGVVRLITHPYKNTAEFALVVGDPWQNQGLGSAFTEFILKIAIERSIKNIYAKFLFDNEPMQKIFKKHKFIISEKEGIGYAELEL